MTQLALSIPDELIVVLAERVAKELEQQQRWITAEGLADYLVCSVGRIHDLRAKGLPARKVGKRLYFSLREVGEWLDREGIR